MRKQVKLLLLIINFLVVFCLFSEKLYAKALHFIAYGDTRRDIKTMEKSQVKHNAIARVIQEMDPDFILFSGDMVYYNEFERFLEVITHNYMGDKMIPLYPAIGNHELIFSEKVDELIKIIEKNIGIINNPKEQISSSSNLSNDGDIEGLRTKLFKEIESIVESKIKTRSRQVLVEEFKDKLNPAYISYLKEVLNETDKEQSWYSFVKEVNGVEIKFIILNSSLPDDAEQFQWFLNELKQFRGPKIILEHYPSYSVGFHGCTDLLDSKSKASRFRDRYTRFFNDVPNNIILVISGHEHNYQRICKMNETGSMQLPLYIVSGGGGADLTGWGECDVSQIPFDGFHCAKFVTAYNFVDAVANTDSKNNLILRCKVLGLRYDLTKGLPADDIFERQFVKDYLELIDDFTLNWQK